MFGRWPGHRVPTPAPSRMWRVPSGTQRELVQEHNNIMRCPLHFAQPLNRAPPAFISIRWIHNSPCRSPGAHDCKIKPKQKASGGEARGSKCWVRYWREDEGVGSTRLAGGMKWRQMASEGATVRVLASRPRLPALGWLIHPHIYILSLFQTHVQMAFGHHMQKVVFIFRLLITDINLLFDSMCWNVFLSPSWLRWIFVFLVERFQLSAETQW